jgi:hypothetical protein
MLAPCAARVCSSGLQHAGLMNKLRVAILPTLDVPKSGGPVKPEDMVITIADQ